MTSHVKKNIKEIVALAQNGNIEARNKMIELAIPTVKRSIQDQDEFQNAIVRIIKYFNNFNAEKGNFNHWVSVIAKNEKRKNWEQETQRRQKYISLPENTGDYNNFINFFNNVKPLEFEFPKKDRSETIFKAINMLKKRQREVFEMHFFEGLTHKEISKFLKINEGTSKSQLFYALKRIEEVYNKLNN